MGFFMRLNLSTYQRSVIAGAVVIPLMACSSWPSKPDQSKAIEQISQSQIGSAQAVATTRKVPTPMLIFKGHSERVTSVVFSPDSQLIASASYDDTVKLWNPETGQVICTFSVEPAERDYGEGFVFSIESSSKISFSQDGKILTLGNGYNALISWQVDTGKVVRKIKGREDYTAGVAFSPNGNFFANTLAINRGSLSVSGLAGLSTEQMVQRLSQSTFLPEGNIGIWDVRTGQRTSTIPKTGLVLSMAFSSDNRFLVSTDLGGESQLWDLNLRRLLRK
ncbi:MAG TPA: hypothetical protein V6D18_12060 [Thermosynechococcaceae cyanobacterium]